MGGRGCRRVDTLGELREAVSGALDFSRSRRVIVEEYMEGPEFSVDALVYKGELILCGLADRHIFFPPYFIEMGHTMPTDIAPEQIQALLEVFGSGVEALGITLGAAKGDLKLTPQGPRIGEIAARLSGGYMSGWTYPYSSKVNPVEGAIEIALGLNPLNLSPQLDWTSAERAFISIPGTVAEIRGIPAAREIPGIRDLFLRVKEGSRVIFPENNVTKCGNVISAAPTRGEAISTAEAAVRRIHLVLEAPNPATDAFLGVPLGPGAGTFKFPPDAFETSPELRHLLAELPEEKPFPPLPWEAPSPGLLDFPALRSGDPRDLAGRTLEETLETVRDLTGLPLPLTDGQSPEPVFARGFWQALLRGGYQGGVYYIYRKKLEAGA